MKNEHRERIQFIHFETYALKKTKTKASIKSILEEMTRTERYCKHIDQVTEPNPVYLNPDFSPETTLPSYKAQVLDYFTYVQKKTKTKKLLKHRCDENIALVGVASFPFTILEMQQAYVLKLYQRFRDLTVEFLKDTYQNNLLMIVEHFDEAYAHLHFVVRGDIEAKLGKVLTYCINKVSPQKRIKSERRDLTINQQSALIKEELNQYQNRYFNTVSIKLGFLRKSKTPRRRIYDTKLYKKIKEQQEQELALARKKREQELVGITMTQEEQDQYNYQR